jgi:hypothetical protein
MGNVPVALGLAFVLTTGLAVWLFYRAMHQSARTLYVLLAWLLLQAGLSLQGVYVAPEAMPPRLALALVPTLLVIGVLFLTHRGRVYVDGLQLDTLTWLHVVRVPVELVLFGLFLYQVVPERMTFEGRNWDILSGLSAPLVYYAVFRGKQLGRIALLGWNIACLSLLLNVVITAWPCRPRCSGSRSTNPMLRCCTSRTSGCLVVSCRWCCWRMWLPFVS